MYPFVQSQGTQTDPVLLDISTLTQAQRRVMYMLMYYFGLPVTTTEDRSQLLDLISAAFNVANNNTNNTNQ